MKRSILALASGAFVLGAAEFVMMGILPQAAAAMGVDIPTAGNYISSYAIGVCIGTLMLVFGRRVPPKRLIVLFMAIALAGNLLSAVSLNSPMLIAARFIAGLPHGAFFGTATLIAKTLADKGKEAQAVSMMVTGQTVANMLGVPAGTLMAEFMSWRLAFGILAAWAAMTVVLVLTWVPRVEPIRDAGLAGQFRFDRTSRLPDINLVRSDTRPDHARRIGRHLDRSVSDPTKNLTGNPIQPPHNVGQKKRRLGLSGNHTSRPQRLPESGIEISVEQRFTGAGRISGIHDNQIVFRSAPADKPGSQSPPH